MSNPGRIPPPPPDDHEAKEFNENDDADMEKCVNDTETFNDKYNENQSKIYENLTKSSTKNTGAHIKDVFEKMKHFLFNLPKSREIQPCSFVQYRSNIQIIMTLVLLYEKSITKNKPTTDNFVYYVEQIF